MPNVQSPIHYLSPEVRAVWDSLAQSAERQLQVFQFPVLLFKADTFVPTGFVPERFRKGNWRCGGNGYHLHASQYGDIVNIHVDAGNPDDGLKGLLRHFFLDVVPFLVKASWVLKRPIFIPTFKDLQDLDVIIKNQEKSIENNA